MANEDGTTPTSSVTDESTPINGEASYSRLLKAETGHSSYESYLKATNGPDSAFADFLMSILKMRRASLAAIGETQTGGHCVILEIRKSQDGGNKIGKFTDVHFITKDLKRSGRIYNQDNEQVYSSRNERLLLLLKAVLSPVLEHHVRIILWYTEYADSGLEMIDILGTVLGVPASFMDVLLSRHTTADLNQLDRKSIIGLESDYLHHDYVVIGNFVAAFLSQKGNSSSYKGPTVLLVYSSTGKVDDQYGDETVRHLEHEARQHLSPWSTEEPQSSYLKHLNEGSHKTFILVLLHLLYQPGETDCADSHLFYISLLPILRFNTALLRKRHNAAQQTFSEIKATDEHADSLDSVCFDLRREIEGFEDRIDIFQGLVLAGDGEEFFQSNQYLAVKRRWIPVLAMARRLESEIRDHMLLTVSKLSI